MFGLFKNRKSPVRRRLEASISVRRTWFEWTLENGRREATLVVEYEYDTDPSSPDFADAGLDEIAAAVAATERARSRRPRVRIIPRGLRELRRKTSAELQPPAPFAFSGSRSLRIWLLNGRFPETPPSMRSG